jgi:TfoX/Sxy family transcriptional regulator of competence genes
MAYDEGLAQRIRDLLDERAGVSEKKMFGGLAFLLAGNMVCGVVGDELMVRVGAEAHDEAIAKRHARPMDFTGRPMKGFVFVGVKGIESDRDLRDSVERSVAHAALLPRRSAPRKPRRACRDAFRAPRIAHTFM